jgi:serine/threonine protein phosphatase 1
MGIIRAINKSEPTTGPVFRTPPGRRIYAIGDIHGRLDLLDRLLALIRQDSAGRPKEASNVLVFLGDYVDRGPDSAGVLDRIGDVGQEFEAHRLLGNHEAMMRDVLAGDANWFETWGRNGAAETLESYGLKGPWSAKAIELARRRIPPAHRRLLDGLATHHVEGDYVFVHAGLRPGIALEHQDPQDLIWIRRTFLDSDADFGRMVVHGHSISPEIVVKPNRIGIDTGAYRSGTLSCIALEGSEQRILQTA